MRYPNRKTSELVLASRFAKRSMGVILVAFSGKNLMAVLIGA
jgi:hypothetical protein